MKPRLLAAASFAGSLLLQQAAFADSVSLAPVKDNTLYESSTGSFSNGAGEFLFCGRVATGEIRRGLLAFDIASNIPAGSTITRARLRLHLSRTLPVGAVSCRLHRVLADWGEGTSNAGGGGGGGAVSTPGDATWIHTFFPGAFWAATGGDFDATASAVGALDQIGSYDLGPTSGMAADVQAWLDSPASNFGWILLGDESTAPTAKRLDTRENLTAAFRPELRVDFTGTVAVLTTTWSRVLGLYR